jgi:hypothetical protein
MPINGRQIQNLLYLTTPGFESGSNSRVCLVFDRR